MDGEWQFDLALLILRLSVAYIFLVVDYTGRLLGLSR
jgi:hypothetical protein